MSLLHQSLTRRERLWLLGRRIVWILMVGACAQAVWVFDTVRTMDQKIYADVHNLPPMPAAIVFGAGVKASGQPTEMLLDRVKTGVIAFKNKKAEKLIMSGAKYASQYDEPQAMQRVAVEEGVPAYAVEQDTAGYRTYDTITRAIDVYHLPRVLLVTQRYHLFRALFIAQALGLDAVGLAADRQDYVAGRWQRILREAGATELAWCDVHFRRRRS